MAGGPGFREPGGRKSPSAVQGHSLGGGLGEKLPAAKFKL